MPVTATRARSLGDESLRRLGHTYSHRHSEPITGETGHRAPRRGYRPGGARELSWLRDVRHARTVERRLEGRRRTRGRSLRGRHVTAVPHRRGPLGARPLRRSTPTRSSRDAVGDLSTVVVLRDGTRALIRPIGPEDRGRLKAGFESASAESIFLRFLAPHPRLSSSELGYLTAVDHVRHEALIAVDPDTRRELRDSALHPQRRRSGNCGVRDRGGRSLDADRPRDSSARSARSPCPRGRHRSIHGPDPFREQGDQASGREGDRTLHDNVGRSGCAGDGRGSGDGRIFPRTRHDRRLAPPQGRLKHLLAGARPIESARQGGGCNSAPGLEFRALPR